MALEGVPEALQCNCWNRREFVIGIENGLNAIGVVVVVLQLDCSFTVAAIFLLVIFCTLF